MGLQFWKYQGLGNDYLVYDCCKNSMELNKEAIALICDRNYGLGSDGLLVGPIMTQDGIGVRIYNPDGSEVEKSGNGARIFAKYLKDAGYIQKKNFKLNTINGKLDIHYNNELGNIITINMGKLSFNKEDIGCEHMRDEMINLPLYFNRKEYWCTCVAIGNPHCVIPMDEVSKDKVCEIGRYSECAPYFKNRVNTQIVKVLDRHNIQIEIYERGVGYTLSSGSGSCAAAGAMYKLGMTSPEVTVHMPGGNMKIKIDEDDNVFMTGSVSRIAQLELAEEFIVPAVRVAV